LAPDPQADSIDTLEADDAAFLQWLFNLAGLDARQYRPESLARRLPACLRKLRVSSVTLARAALQRSPKLVDEAINSLLIGVTGFFRDEPLFEQLASQILPGLTTPDRMLRIWSAGCSDGSELYSVAMLLWEMGRLNGVELLGTDCRGHATRCAARGVYDQASLGGVSPERLAAHFVRMPRAGVIEAKHSPEQWCIKPPLRQAAKWRTANILETVEPGPWDLILFRNTSMYLRGGATVKMWDHLISALLPGGYLILGNAERPAPMPDLIPIGQCIYRRHG
jgi:chemotaxis methyl-accepting protein methylase